MYSPEMERLLQQMEAYSREHDGVYAIPREEGVFLNMLVRLKRARRIVELGTSSGYSTLWLAAAAAEHGGVVETVEFDPQKVALASENIRRSGLEKTIRMHHADAAEFLGALEGEVDFVFMDTEKEDYLRHFRLAFPKLARGGLVAADNAVDLADNMRDFLDYVKRLEGAQSVTVGIGNGLELTCKL
ncbi:MAG TPA: O-methyltransferase [Acidobacteriota bacterium]|nr:O-methyltransferase [Acidobacteriota bacterium]